MLTTAAPTVENFELRLGVDTEITHVVRRGFVRAVCGANARRPSPQHGQPCAICFDKIADPGWQQHWGIG